LITGIAGFLGSHLGERLLAGGPDEDYKTVPRIPSSLEKLVLR
ncbi:MAG: GDP-mannose 4,6 dehydratase, partial [Deltaproteobacteria bacterium]